MLTRNWVVDYCIVLAETLLLLVGYSVQFLRFKLLALFSFALLHLLSVLRFAQIAHFALASVLLL